MSVRNAASVSLVDPFAFAAVAIACATQPSRSLPGWLQEVPELMSIQLSPRTEALIREQVDSGRYATADQVIDEAPQALDERDRLRRLRASLIEAEAEVERGEGVEWTPALMEQLRQEADELYRRGIAPDPDVCP